MTKSFATNLIAIIIIFIGYFSPYYAEEIKAMGLYSFSGAITNWLAIHMLFEKVPFLYGSGIITERFQEFKAGIKNLIMNQFFTEENFKKFLGRAGKSISLDENKILNSVNYEKIFSSLKDAIMTSPFGGMLNMFGGEAALLPLKPSINQKIQEIIKDLLHDEDFITSFKGGDSNQNMMKDVSFVVEERLGELTPKMVKDIIQEMIRSHLGWLVVWGGVFGALIGFFSTFIN